MPAVHDLALTECGWPIVPGRRVRARVSVWNDGGDHHPPGFLCQAGEVLHVLRPATWIYPVGRAFVLSHAPDEGTYGGFVAYRHELELYWEQPDLFPEDLRFGQYHRGGVVPRDLVFNIRGIP